MVILPPLVSGPGCSAGAREGLAVLPVAMPILFSKRVQDSNQPDRKADALLPRHVVRSAVVTKVHNWLRPAREIAVGSHVWPWGLRWILLMAEHPLRMGSGATLMQKNW